MNKLFFALFFLFFSLTVFAQKSSENQMTRILFIFDFSNSMNAQWSQGKSKLDVAKKLFPKLVDSLDNVPNLQMALRMYGHQKPIPPQDCSDTKLEVPFDNNNGDLIKQMILNAKAQGTTPIANSLIECEYDFTDCSNCRNIIILITDGIEACDGDPCAVAMALYRKGISLRPFVIGIGLDVKSVEAFKCMGDVYNAYNEKTMAEVFSIVTTQATVPTTAQVNLLDITGKPIETNVNMTFYNQKSSSMLHNYMHTLNFKGLPDTITLTANLTYKMVVHTIPSVTLSDIKLKAGQHNIISAKTPQGTLLIEEQRGTKNRDVPILVRLGDEYLTLNVQKMGTSEKYLVGRYDLEALTIPRTKFFNVLISQSKTTSIFVPEPGITTINMPSLGFASLYIKEDNNFNWVMNLNDKQKIVLNLQPGTYMIVYRPKNGNKTSLTKVKNFDVESGLSSVVDF